MVQNTDSFFCILNVSFCLFFFLQSNYSEASSSHPHLQPPPSRILGGPLGFLSAASHLTKLHFVEVGRWTSRRLEGGMAAQGHPGPTPPPRHRPRPHPSFNSSEAEWLLSLYFYTLSINRLPQTHLCSLTKWQMDTREPNLCARACAKNTYNYRCRQ